MSLFGGTVTAQTTNTSRPRSASDAADNGPDLTPGGPGLVSDPTARLPYEVPESHPSDKQFVQRAVMRGLTQIEIDKLAAEKSSKDSIKQLAKKLDEEHTKRNNQLARIAGRQGVAVPGSLDPKHQARVERLAKLSGDDFDRAFLKRQVQMHEADVQDFERESQEGADAAMKAYALKKLPAIQDDLEKVKNLGKSDPRAK